MPLAGLVVALLPPSAHAFDANRLRPALGTKALTTVDSAAVGEHLALRLSVLFHYAHEPLVAEHSDGAPEGTLIARLPMVDTVAALALFDRFELGLGVPAATGLAGSGGRVLRDDPARDPMGGRLGDIRLGVKGAVLARRGPGFGLGLGVESSVATGDTSVWLGDAGPSITPRLLLDLAFDRWVVALNGGYRFRTNEQLLGAPVGDAVHVGLGTRWSPLAALADVAVGAELFGEVPVAEGASSQAAVDALGVLEWALESCLMLTAGGGAGFTSAPGSPQFRVLGGIGWQCRGAGSSRVDEPSPAAPPSAATVPDTDPDHDGVRGAADACPDTPEDFDGFEESDGCPEADNDKDGLVDTADLCPDEAEDRDQFQDEDGCPEPNPDPDPVPDAQETLPPAPPLTRYGDAEVRGRLIVLAHPVVFPPKGNGLPPSARAALADVAALLAARPDLHRLRIEVHSDSQGTDEENLRRTQERAQVIRDLLVDVGVAPDRLEAVGRGESEPVEPNRDEAGRAANRRVELHLPE